MEARKIGSLVILLLLAADVTAATKADYFRLVKQSRDRLSAEFPQRLAEWKASYSPSPFGGWGVPRFAVELAQADAFLFQQTGEQRYADEAAQVLIEIGRLRELYPQEYRTLRKEYQYGLPPLTSFFHFLPYVRAYLWIQGSDVLQPQQRTEIERNIAETADYVFRYHEWGPMNRAILRAAGLVAAARAVPGHPNAVKWERLGRRIANSSLTGWTIEDAHIYNAVWLEGLLMYLDVAGADDVWDNPVMRYYFRYLAQLQTPLGYLAQYGDNHGFWNLPTRYVACLEKGAAIYRDPQLKYAAERLFQAYWNDPNSDKENTLGFLNAALWADDSVPSQPPANGSTEVLEDLFGKKIVFRSGWDSTATFALLNYRNGGEFGRVPKEYLINTIPVETEKPHHGHSDENNFGPLIANGNVLLDYPTYFERADFYHNRLVVRQGEAPPANYRLMPFLRREENHRIVHSEKLHFYTFDGADVSRTRVVDAERGYEWDRIVTYLKDENLFVVFDGVKILKDGLFTLANLWHTQEVLSYGDHWVETRIREVGDRPGRWINPKTMSLIIVFPEGDGKREGVEPLYNWSFARDHDLVAYRAVTDSMGQGNRLAFTTVLIPFDRQGDPGQKVQSIHFLKPDAYPNGVGVRIDKPGETIVITSRLNLEMEILEEEVRPRYTFESGRINYNWNSGANSHTFATDARWAVLRIRSKQVGFAFVEATRLQLDNRDLWHAFVNSFYTYQPSGALVRSAPEKWESWEDVVEW
jgi:hypothetical protein